MQPTSSSSLTTDERAELEALRDLRARLMFVDDDGTGVLGPWVDAHRMHDDEPYIGCPFCRERFVCLRDALAVLEESTTWADPSAYGRGWRDAYAAVHGPLPGGER